MACAYRTGVLAFTLCLFGIFGHATCAALLSHDLIAASEPSAPSAAYACVEGCDTDTVSSLLEQLHVAQTQHSTLKDQLMRTSHHRPIIVTNPLGGVTNSAFQLLSAVLAIACVWSLIRTRNSKYQSGNKFKELQQASQRREAFWQCAMGKEQARLRQLLLQHQQKEAAWVRGVALLTQLVQQQAAALQSSKAEPQVQTVVRSLGWEACLS